MSATVESTPVVPGARMVGTCPNSGLPRYRDGWRDVIATQQHPFHYCDFFHHIRVEWNDAGQYWHPVWTGFCGKTEEKE